jgi:acyl-[acyl-carrier-protein]-phospholipid O-acyltransferase / long-chain-fatty-acid--[acyl-carrier-protein] ligase
MGFDAAAAETTIFDAVLQARAAHGGAKVILQDAEGAAMSYNDLVLASLVLGRKLVRDMPGHEPIGLLLPNVPGLVVALLGLNAYGRTFAVLNYTAGSRNLASALKTGQIRRVVTSRRFIDKGNLHDVIEVLGQQEIRPGKQVRCRRGSREWCTSATGRMRAHRR